MTNQAPYAQLKAYLSHHFVFKAGIRLENVKIQVDDYSVLVQNNPFVQSFKNSPSTWAVMQQYGLTTFGGNKISGGIIDYNATTYNFGLRYTKHKMFKPFISFSQGFSIADLGRVLRNPIDMNNTMLSSLKRAHKTPNTNPQQKLLQAQPQNSRFGFNFNVSETLIREGPKPLSRLAKS